MQSGTLVQRMISFHARYGSVVRTAPDEFSFIDPASSRNIYAAGDGQPRFPENPIGMGDPILRGNSIVDANDENHTRIRHVWSHDFTGASLKRQEPLSDFYVYKLIEGSERKGTVRV